MQRSFKNRLAADIASTYFVPKSVACFRVLHLFGRLLGALDPDGANNYSLNRLGLLGVLRLLLQAFRSNLRKVKSSVKNTSGGAINIAKGNVLTGMFKAGMGYTVGLERLVALTGVGFQVHDIIHSLANKGSNILNNSKSIARRTLSTLSFTQNIVLLLLLISAYVVHVPMQITREELQGLYVIGVFLNTFFELFMEKLFVPKVNVSKKLNNGIVCINDVENVQSKANNAPRRSARLLEKSARR